MVDTSNSPESSLKRTAPKSISGFVCGLLGFILGWFPVVGLILAIIGVTVCSNGKKIVQRNPCAYKSKELLTIGQILGIFGIVTSATVLLVTLVWGVIITEIVLRF